MLNDRRRSAHALKPALNDGSFWRLSARRDPTIGAPLLLTGLISSQSQSETTIHASRRKSGQLILRRCRQTIEPEPICVRITDLIPPSAIEFRRAIRRAR